MAFWKHGNRDKDLDEELQSHLRMAAKDRMERGDRPSEAELAARRELGNAGLIKEVTRETWGWRWLGEILMDLRFGGRMLSKNPGFTAVAVMTIALAIGANTAIFTIVNAAILRPLPYPSPDLIVAVSGIAPIQFQQQSDSNFIWNPIWADWADRLATLDRIAAYEAGEINLAGIDAEPERIEAAEVTQNFFESFGLPPLAGRIFLPNEEVAGHPSVAILSNTLCNRFGLPRDVIGRTILLNGKKTEVIGVMPPGFDFPNKTAIWLPFAWNLDQEMLLKQALFFDTLGRMKPGATTAKVREELIGIASRPPGNLQDARQRMEVKSMHDELVGTSKPAMLIMLGAVGFVLLIACADVANLLLARAVQRQREIALRAALGASRMRLIRLGLTESVLLSLIGAVAGLFLAYASIGAIESFIPANLLFIQHIRIDVYVLLFLIFVSLLSGLLFGLFPILHALRIDLNEPLKQAVLSSPSRGSFLGRTRNMLVIVEIAMALVLLSGAGLLIKSFWRLTSVDPGFHPERVLTARIGLPPDLYPQQEQRAQFFGETLRRLQLIPGVVAAGYTSNLPFGREGRIAFKIELEKETPASQAGENDKFVMAFEVSADYFRTMGIPLLAGRYLLNSDGAVAPRVVVISNSLAETFWPGENPLGKRLSLPYKTVIWAEIVGIVGDAKYGRLDEKITPAYYMPIMQLPPTSAFLAVRSAGDPGTIGYAVRHAITGVDSTLPLSTYRSMNELVSASVSEPRFRTILLGIFAGLALVLAATGIYGVISYSVVQRTREIGIRVAMGAHRSDILKLVLGQTLRMTVIGIAIGLAASWGLTQLLITSLYGVMPHDFATMLSVSVLLSGVAFLASYIPAQRAMCVDPMVALRQE
jgi:putative ABC transport system permease protein